MKALRGGLVLGAVMAASTPANATWLIAYDCTHVTNSYSDSGIGSSCATFYPKKKAKEAAVDEFWGDADGQCDDVYDGSESFWDAFCDGVLDSHLSEGHYSGAYSVEVVYGLYPTHNTNYGDLYDPGECISPTVNSPTWSYTVTSLGGGCWQAQTQTVNYRCGCKVESDYYY